MADTSTKGGFMFRRRYWFMAAGLLLFLPPFSPLFQLTADANFCGTWCPRMFFVWRKGQTAHEFVLGIIRNRMGVILLVTVLVATLFLGRWWCSHVCPVGGFLELAGRLVPRRLKLNYSAIPAPSFRYGYLLVYLGIGAVGLGSLCCNYCNYAAVPKLLGAAFTRADMMYFMRTTGLISLALVLLLGVFAKGGRAYCNLICPLGALDALMNRLGLKWGRRMRVDASRCVGCGSCGRVCPTWAIEVKDNKAGIDGLSCIPCGECRNKCPEGAIGYGKQ